MKRADNSFKQRILLQNVSSLIWLGTFRYNCTRCQLNNEKRGEIHNIKRSPDKERNNMTNSKQITFEATSAWGYENIVFILKYISITSISIERYTEGVIR